MTTVYLPTPHYLLSIRNQGMPWWKAISEMVDNSFDAGANQVSIAFKGNALIVSDDGKGMKDVTAAIRLGDHQPQGKGLGVYGVGLKDAWLSFGDRIDIETVRQGKLTSLTVDINSLNERWEGPDPIVTESKDDPHTRITIHVRRDKNKPGDQVKEKLGWVFSPGLLAGKQITWAEGKQCKPIVAAKLPAFIEAVEDSFDVEGKAVCIRIGIMKDGERILNGPFWVSYRHRVIESCSIGCKGSDTLRLGGSIMLGDGWVFTKNKDAISENYDQLANAIHARIWSLLQKAEKLSIDVETMELKDELAEMLNNAIGTAKREKRNSDGDCVGSVAPKRTGRKRTDATKINDDLPGSVITKNDGARKRGFKIDFNYGGDGSLGSFDNRENTVRLNLDHPYVAAIRNQKNTQALFAIAVAILTDWLCTHKDSEKCLFEVESFGPTFSNLVRSMRCDDGNRKAAQ